MSRVPTPKQRLRAAMKRTVESVPTRERALASERVHELLLALPEWTDASIVLLYHAMPDEVDTHETILAALASQKRVYLPRVAAGKMGFHRLVDESVEAHLAGGHTGQIYALLRGKRREDRLVRVDLVRHRVIEEDDRSIGPLGQREQELVHALAGERAFARGHRFHGALHRGAQTLLGRGDAAHRNALRGKTTSPERKMPALWGGHGRVGCSVGSGQILARRPKDRADEKRDLEKLTS